jgi:MFS superfamily sulfate permease-like transporter
VQIGGPTGAFIVIVYGVVERFGYEGLAVATFIAGILLVMMGLARLGTVIKFVPYPVTVGFTGGIALIIAASQVRDFLGLRWRVSQPTEKIGAYGEHIASWNPWALVVGFVTILCVGYWPRISTRVPGPLVAIVLTTAAVSLFGIPVETIGDRFGSVPSSLPMPSALPALSMADIRAIFPAAVSIALLAAIESLLSAVVSDGMIGARHRSNTELIAQGIANMVSPDLRRHPRHRRHRSHRDQRQERRALAGSRHRPCHHAARHHVLLRRRGGAHPDGDACRHLARRRLQHERVAGLRASVPQPAQRRHRADDDLRAHGRHRSDGRAAVGIVLAAFLFMRRVAVLSEGALYASCSTKTASTRALLPACCRCRLAS